MKAAKRPRLIPVGKAPSTEASLRRISSRRPLRIALGIALPAVLALAAGTSGLLHGQHGEWIWIAPATFCVLGTFLFNDAFKTVRVADDHFIISTAFRSEVVSFNDVCLIVDAETAMGSRVRIHFARRTRFGWSVSFVPAASFAIEGNCPLRLPSR